MAKTEIQQNEYQKKLLANLNPSQKEAVFYGAGPLLLVAGAGTGKTTVITRRIAYLISQGIKPEEILALTFTDKAAQEMEERVDVLLPYGYYDLWISTFHAFCERILKQHALDIGIPNDYKVLDTIGQRILVRKNLDRFELDYYKPLGNPNKFINELVKHFGKLKDEEIHAEEYLAYAQKLKLDSDNPDETVRITELANAYNVYQSLLLENDALDFGDLINYTLTLFRKRSKILKHYQDTFKFILVDEFQDTNFAQYELVKMLAAPKNNLNVVGDDDQSIYKFRGASVSNILQFKKDFLASQEITLNENYRSTQNILDLSYQFIQANNPERLEAQLDINKKLHSNISDPGAVEVLSGHTLSDEIDLVVNKILELKNNQSANWNDFAILVRANDQADPFISKLAMAGLPYIFYANKGLYKKTIILDLIYYMRLLLNYHDSSVLYRVLMLDLFRISQKDLVTILHYAHKKTLSLYDALEMASAILGLEKETLSKIQKLLSLLKEHGAMAMQKNIAELFINIVKDLEIANRIDEDTIENLENREILEQFYKKIESFESENSDKSLRNFLEMLDFEQEAGEEGKLNFDPNQGPESIKIMTIHGSKGLEFTYVFVVNMVHLRFPSISRKDPIEIPTALVKEILPEGDVHLQEERRLFYVAMTRAKRGLYLTYALDYGGKQSKKPSQFLMDLKLVAKPEKHIQLMREEMPKQELGYDPNIFLPETFSYTQLADFIHCPLRYKYRYLLHLPVEGSATLSFGQSLHKTLEKFLLDYKNQLSRTQLDLFDKKGKTDLPSFAELKKTYEASWIDEWYETKAQKLKFRERGLDIIKKFYAEFKAKPVAPKYLEKSFRMNLGNYFFTGKIDRADLIDGKLQIFDYKTGQTRLENDKESRAQLLIYQWAAQEYLKEEVSALRFWYLTSGELSEPFLGSSEELEELKGALLKRIEEIREAARTNSFKELDKKVNHTCEFEELE